jgi:hypothetical protein
MLAPSTLSRPAIDQAPLPALAWKNAAAGTCRRPCAVRGKRRLAENDHCDMPSALCLSQETELPFRARQGSPWAFRLAGLRAFTARGQYCRQPRDRPGAGW